MDRRQTTEYIIIHHSKSELDFPAFIRFRHMYLRGWEDIGYHYLVGNGRLLTKNGRVYAGRPEENVGAHAIGYNKNSLGICILGNFDRRYPELTQTSGLIKLLADKIRKYKIPAKNILGHHEIAGVNKSCPGKHFDMDYLRAILTSI
jgi:N-acetylmuramoyl-L-alanine amidase